MGYIDHVNVPKTPEDLDLGEKKASSRHRKTNADSDDGQPQKFKPPFKKTDVGDLGG